MQLPRSCAALRHCAVSVRSSLSRSKGTFLPCRAFTAAGHRKGPSDEDDDNIRFRFWEQYGPRREDVREIETGDPTELQKELERLRKEIYTLRDKIAPEGDDELDNLLTELMDPEGKEGGRNLLDVDVDDDDANKLDVSLRLPRTLRVHLQNFNQLTRTVAKDLSKDEHVAKNQRAHWLQYLRCKRSVPSFVEQVPQEAWDVLWESQTNLITNLDDREDVTKHLRTLVEDMTKAKKELSPAQKFIMIEQLLADGRHQAALEAWLRGKKELQHDDGVSSAYTELGVRIMVASGHLGRAQELVFETSKDKDKVQAKDFAPLIAAWADKGDEASIKFAWSLYLYMRDRKGMAITLEDFDAVAKCFLRSQRLQLALAVFKDMLLAGKGSPFDSAALARKAQDLHAELRKNSDGLADLNEVSLTALAYLPKRFENRWFYGSWMKRLIGLGDLEGATQVMQLMFERGTRPDALHVNGIIGAHLRGFDTKKQHMAIQFAWEMVKERLKFVERRQVEESGAPLELDLPDPGLKVPPYITRALPPATIETFSILLHYYERRDMLATVEKLPAILERAEIPPNAFIMNHRMFSHLRKGDTAGAWQIFQSSSEAIKPDLESFAALWECLRARLSWHGHKSSEELPSPRAAFARMMSWHAGLRPQRARAVRLDFNPELYNLIVRCLCLDRDVEGALVALHALRRTFGALPDANTVRLIAMQLARPGEPTGRRARRRRAQPPDAGQKRLEEVLKLLEGIAERRREELDGGSTGAEERAPEEIRAEGLHRLNIWLRTFLQSRCPELDSDEKMDSRLEQVAAEMGTEGLRRDESLPTLKTQ